MKSCAAIQFTTETETDPIPHIYDFFWADVVSLQKITPLMTRFIFKIDVGNRFVPSKCLDEWFRLFFKPNAETPRSLQVRDENRKWRRPRGAEPCPDRPYTVRRWDGSRHEMTIDIVAHANGLATKWAKSVRPGDRVGVSNLVGRFRLSKQTELVMIVTDVTGLSAVARVVEELPPGFTARAHIEISSEADRQPLRKQADLDLTWYVGSTKTLGVKGRSSLATIAAGITTLSAGNGYIYNASEARMVSRSRKHFRDVLCLDKNRIEATGYWIEG